MTLCNICTLQYFTHWNMRWQRRKTNKKSQKPNNFGNYSFRIYEIGQRGQWGTIVSNEMLSQNPVWKEYIQMTFKIRSMPYSHCQIFASSHSCKSVQNYFKYENSFNIIRYENNCNQRQQWLRSQGLFDVLNHSWSQMVHSVSCKLHVCRSQWGTPEDSNKENFGSKISNQ